MADILTSINTRKTPQSAKAREDQVKNSAGGYVFEIGDEARLHRFLTLGTDQNSYYTSAGELTRQNAEVVFRMAEHKHDELVAEILAVSEAGRAPKNKQAIFALAIAASTADPVKNAKALAVMHKVCRTGTMLFEFNKYVEQFRGRGRTLNRAVANWYLKKDVDKVAYQVTKYRQRDGMSHRDLLRLVKPGQYGPKSPERNALFDFIIHGSLPEMYEPGGLAIVEDFLTAQAATTAKQWIEVINRGHGLSWEMLPDAARKEPAVWEAMIDRGMPQTALMRQLPTLTRVFGGPGNWVTKVATQIQDKEKLVKGRVHPIQVLMAQATYASGHGFRGQSSWDPIPALVDALDAGFYNSYGAVEPSGKRILLALDVSGSMGFQIGDTNLTCRGASSALALVTLNAELPGSTEVVGFTSGKRYGGYGGYNGVDPISRLDITPRRRLDDVVAYTNGLDFGGTDCALPALWAHKQNLDFDAIVILTDNESWAGSVHPFQAMKSYREKVGHDVKLVAVGMTATNYSVADPKDASSLNVSGFDGAVPNLISDFIAGRL